MELLVQNSTDKEDIQIEKAREREEKHRISLERDSAMTYLAPGHGAFNTISIQGSRVTNMKQGIDQYIGKAMISL